MLPSRRDVTKPESHAHGLIVLAMLFSACATGGLKTGGLVADQIVLRSVYGWDRVSRERLEIVESKPELVASNGDVLEGWGFPHFLVAAVVFIATTIAAVLAANAILPRSIRELGRRTKSHGSDRVDAGCGTAAVFLLLALLLVGSASLWANVIVAALAIGLAWVPKARRST